MSDIEARLTRLERSARRWRLAALGLGALVAVACGGKGGPAGPGPTAKADDGPNAIKSEQDLNVRSIRTKSLAIVSKEGNDVGTWEAREDGSHELSISRATGDGGTRFQFVVYADGTPSITLFGLDNKPRASIDVNSTDRVSITQTRGPGYPKEQTYYFPVGE